MEIFVGADYRGFELKNELLKFLVENNYNAKHVSDEVTKLYLKFAK